MFSNFPSRSSVRRVAALSALALAMAGAIESSGLAAAEASYCAVGSGHASDTAGVGCTFGGDAGAAIAGKVHTTDLTMTIAGSIGAPSGGPAVSVAGQLDLSPLSFEVVGAAGGQFPSPAGTVIVSYP